MSPRNLVASVNREIKSNNSSIIWAAGEATRFQKLVIAKQLNGEIMECNLTRAKSALLEKEENLKIKRVALGKICKKKDSFIVRRKSRNHQSIMSGMMKDM